MAPLPPSPSPPTAGLLCQAVRHAISSFHHIRTALAPSPRPISSSCTGDKTADRALPLASLWSCQGVPVRYTWEDGGEEAEHLDWPGGTACHWQLPSYYYSSCPFLTPISPSCAGDKTAEKAFGFSLVIPGRRRGGGWTYGLARRYGMPLAASIKVVQVMPLPHAHIL
jgi:hypothetical protein